MSATMESRNVIMELFFAKVKEAVLKSAMNQVFFCTDFGTDLIFSGLNFYKMFLHPNNV